MSYRQLIKLIDRQAKIQEDLQEDCSLEENSLPSDARAQRRELDHKADLHNTFANALRDVSADGETEEGVVSMLKDLSADLLAKSYAPSNNRAENAVEIRMIRGFRAVITSILSQVSGDDMHPGLPAHLVAELEALTEDSSIDVLNILRARHDWAGSLVTVSEIREELEMLVPEVTEAHIAAVKATDDWRKFISENALEVTQRGLATAVDASLR